MNKQRLLEVAADLEAGNLPPDTAFNMMYSFLTKSEVDYFESSGMANVAERSALKGCGSCCCIAGLIAFKWGRLDLTQSNSSDGILDLAASLMNCEIVGMGKGIEGLFNPVNILPQDWDRITTTHAATAVRQFVATGDGLTCWDAVAAELRGGEAHG